MTSKKTKKIPDSTPRTQNQQEYSLILHNDDVHSFDYVIDALVDICDHDYEQAVQCTIITHHKGCCDVRKGTMETLKKMKDSLIEKELSATINPES